LAAKSTEEEEVEEDWMGVEGGIICTICSNKTNKSRGDSQRQRQRVEADGNIAVMTRVKEGDRAAHQMA
jgi:hypothetical protein